MPEITLSPQMSASGAAPAWPLSSRITAGRLSGGSCRSTDRERLDLVEKWRFACYDVRMFYRHAATTGLVLALAGLLGGQLLAEGSEAEACFDAEVSARLVGQTPSVIPELDDGSIVMEWPWFLDLEIQRVVRGKAPTGKVTVLSVQHTYWVSNLGTKRWQLRRNDQGAFNVLGHADKSKLKPCPAGTPLAHAYLSPGKGNTLERLREEGEKRYGRQP